MGQLERLIGERFATAIDLVCGAAGAAVDPVLRPTQDPRFGDFQANVAMGLAKRLGKPPREVAQAIVDALPADGLASRIEIAGPGFINLHLDDGFLARLVAAALADPRLGVSHAEPALRVVVDYSGPNVAKEMHVGHLRSTVIGDAVARVLAFCGHTVVRQNHVGDWGTQFGLLIQHLIEQAGPDGDPAALDATVDLTTLYRAATARDGTDAAFAERARQRVVALQSGDADTRRLWQRLVELSALQFQGVYRRLDSGLQVDDIRGESAYETALPAVVAELQAQGLARESDGALGVFLPGFQTKSGEPLPLLVRKSDGGYLYATTDLAAVRYRIRTLGARRLVYVTDARQRQHFQMVFAAARAAGWAAADTRLDHVVFGSVLGADGKPFKTRSGDTVRLATLLDEAEQRAGAIVAAKDPELSTDDRARVAHAVGIGAIKYADLASDRVKDYVFEWDRMLAMDGNTAPYLQYAYARIRSIFRKAEQAEAPVVPVCFADPAERALALCLLRFDAVVDTVVDTLAPHHLCGYLYEVATAFSTFYRACPILAAPPELRGSRLVLCELTARTLAIGLGLLGIETLERM